MDEIKEPNFNISFFIYIFYIYIFYMLGWKLIINDDNQQISYIQCLPVYKSNRCMHDHNFVSKG